MSGWLNVVSGVVLGLMVNEGTDMSPWLAHKIVRWAAVIRRPERIEDFTEARAATVNDRPGKLFKLFTAFGFLFAALVHRATRPGPANRPSLLGVLRVRLQAAGIAGSLFAATWGLIALSIGEPAYEPMVIMGSALFAVAVVVVHLPPLRSATTALNCTVLPAALMSPLWIDAVPVIPLAVATMIAPVYGAAEVVRATLRDSPLAVGIGSTVAVGVVVTVAANLAMFGSSDLQHFLALIGMGVVGGLCLGVGLLVVEHSRKRWNPAPPPEVVPVPGRG